MATFFFRAKYSVSAIKGMVENPQDREAAIRALCNSANMDVETIYFSPATSEVFLITSGDHITKDALVMMIMGTGAFDLGSEVLEVVDSKTFQETMQKASDLIGVYKVAGSSS